MGKKIQEVTTALKLIKKFALVGAFTPQLDESVVPVVITDDLTDVEEWRDAFFGEARPQVGAAFNKWQLTMPVNTGRVAEVYLVQLSTITTPSTGQWFFVVNTSLPDLTTPLTGRFQDLRTVPNEIPSMLVRFEATAGLLPVQVWHVGNLDSGQTIIPFKVLIYPGTSLFVQMETVNQEGTFSCQWRERALRSDGS